MFFSLVLGIIALLATRGVAQEFLEYDCNGSGMCAGFACGGSSGCIQQLHDMINGVNTSRLFMVEEQIACVKPRPGPGICAFYQPYGLDPASGARGEYAIAAVDELSRLPCQKCGSLVQSDGLDESKQDPGLVLFTVNYVTQPCGHGLCQ